MCLFGSRKDYHMKTMKNLLNCRALVFAAFFVARAAHAGTISYTDLDAFNTALGSHSVIQFTELAEGVTVGEQYASRGVSFTDLNDTILADTAFLSDGFGLNGHGSITLQFSSFVTGLGALFPGALSIQLLSDGTAIGNSAAFGGSGEDFFGGVISDIPFNGAVLSDWTDGRVFLDDLYFGPSTGANVPDTGASAALLVISMGLTAILACCVRHEPRHLSARR
jgi:hypothetical protein